MEKTREEPKSLRNTQNIDFDARKVSRLLRDKNNAPTDARSFNASTGFRIRRTKDLSFFFEKEGVTFFLVLRANGGVGRKSARITSVQEPLQTSYLEIFDLFTKAERIESTLRRRVVKDDERRGRRTQKRRRRSAAPRGSESAKRIHDHENQRKLDGRGTPTVRRGHRAVRRPRGFGFFSSFFFSFFNSSRQTKTFLRCSAGKRDVFVSWKNRTIRRARECRQTLPLFFLSHFVSPSSTLLLPRDETDTSGTGSKLKNT